MTLMKEDSVGDASNGGACDLDDMTREIAPYRCPRGLVRLSERVLRYRCWDDWMGHITLLRCHYALSAYDARKETKSSTTILSDITLLTIQKKNTRRKDAFSWQLC